MSNLKPLPEGDGPKLEPFNHDLLADDVEFLEFLGHYGIHGAIVKTRIRGHLYAIKFFTETELAEPEYIAEDYETIPVEKHHEFESHFIPFYQECRAFGRLKEVNREHLAVKVYGYVSLKVDQALELKMRNALRKIRCDPKLFPMTARSILITSSEIKGIVKDWVEPAKFEGESDIPSHRIDSILSVSHFPRMLEELHEIHRCGIVIRDMSITQYVNGILVDFSMAWTMPHPFGPGGGFEPAWTFQSLAAWDLFCFQTTVIDLWNNVLRGALGTSQRECRLQAYPHPAQYKTFRPQPFRQRPFLPIINQDDEVLDMIELPRYDPGDFNAEEAAKMVREQNKRKRDSGECVGPAKKKRRFAKKYSKRGETRGSKG
ncbi:hypothetical protein LCI18_012203 [Fusarium solani-melongenae]|uniref:Uncharacterized protein n=1 Tax=Fusarium solani subsp. cucurbitae TaxID=2747967 RepID=A0ACD3ZME8_FUSSC|nr:hypothetical protein LCI18_012203 [Fusarium solani-melongenae]